MGLEINLRLLRWRVISMHLTRKRDLFLMFGKIMNRPGKPVGVSGNVWRKSGAMQRWRDARKLAFHRLTRGCFIRAEQCIMDLVGIGVCGTATFLDWMQTRSAQTPASDSLASRSRPCSATVSSSPSTP